MDLTIGHNFLRGSVHSRDEEKRGFKECTLLACSAMGTRSRLFNVAEYFTTGINGKPRLAASFEKVEL